jgi:hypothetical protein
VVADPDPTYEAYLRALGFQETSNTAAAAKRTADINARAGFETPELGYQHGLAQEAVNADALGRGVWSSGEHDRALAQAGHEYQYKLGSMEMTQSQALGDVQLGLAQSQAQMAGTRAVATARHEALLRADAESRWNAALSANAADAANAGPVWFGPPPVLGDPAGIFNYDQRRQGVM